MRTRTLRRPLVTMTLGVVLFACAALVACAPGLEGRYRISGDYDEPEYTRFQGELHVDDDGKGYALVDVADQPSVRIPLCNVQRTEKTLSFVVDRAYPPSRTCDAITIPLTLQGDIGGHVLVGSIEDADGERVGLWRAFRKFE